MKRIENKWYDTIALSGSHRLMVSGKSLESTRKEIDDSNKKAVSRWCKAERWIITYRERCNSYDDDGRFVKCEECERAVEIYPKEI